VTTPRDGAEWVTRIHSTPRLPRGEKHTLDAWLSSSPGNARDFLRAETIWRLSGAFAHDEAVQAELGRLRERNRVSTASSPRRMLGWAAALTALILGAVFGLRQMQQQTTWYETRAGEQRNLVLADGSTLSINTASRVGVQYDSQQRLLTLERGEALFQVAKDMQRPFIVRAGRGFVRAIGTRFDVLIDSKRNVTVAVLEGRVDVVPQPQTAPAQVDSHMFLDAGQAVAFEDAGKLVQANTEHASTERINAWREGRLRFDAWPLGDAIHEHNRYAAKPIRLGSPELADLKVSGVFRVGDTEALLTALRRLLDVRSVEQQDAIVLTASGAYPQ